MRSVSSRTVTGLVPACCRPPLALSKKREAEITLLVQEALLTRNAFPPQFVMSILLKLLPVHCVPGHSRHPARVGAVDWAMKTP